MYELEGVELDEFGEGLLALDSYRFPVNENGLSFDGRTKGNNKSWNCKIEGICDYLLPSFIEDTKKKKFPNVFNKKAEKFDKEFTIFYGNHLNFYEILPICVCFSKKPPENFPNLITHPSSDFIFYCCLEHHKKYSPKHNKIADELKLINSESEIISAQEIKNKFEIDENFQSIAFYHALLLKLFPTEESRKPSLKLISLLFEASTNYCDVLEFLLLNNQIDDNSLFKVTSYALHLTSNTHFLIKEVEDVEEFDENLHFLEIKDVLLSNLVFLTTLIPYHISLIATYVKERYEHFLRKIAPKKKAAELNLLFIFSLTKQMMYYLILVESDKYCLKLLNEGLLLSKKMENLEWFNFQQSSILIFNQATKREWITENQLKELIFR